MALTSVREELGHDVITSTLTDLRYPHIPPNQEINYLFNSLARGLIAEVNPTFLKTAIQRGVKHEIQQRS